MQRLAFVFASMASLSVAGALSVFSGGCSSDASTSEETTPPAVDPDAAGMKSSGLPQSCPRGTPNTTKPATCNGAAELCDRTYDRVVTPMTHNAMSNREDGFSIPNQTHTVVRQLAAGVRGLMLDVHYLDPEQGSNSAERLPDWTNPDQLYLCHSSCLLGKKRLLEGLCEITAFLDQNPGEIVSIIFENRVTEADLDDVMRASGLSDLAYTHAAGTPWPTLRQLIDSNKRLVAFVEQGGGTPAYLHSAFVGNIRDTPYTFEKKEDFTCRLNRGAAGDPLFLINHWLQRPRADIAFASEANVTGVLDVRIQTCTTEVGRPPTFVGVDFYEVGDLFPSVRKANGLP